MNRRNFIKNTLIAAAVAAGSSILGKTAKSALLRENKKMKILVLTGSPRPNGNSNTLADNFIKGAEAAGHKVFRFDAADSLHAQLGLLWLAWSRRTMRKAFLPSKPIK